MLFDRVTIGRLLYSGHVCGALRFQSTVGGITLGQVLGSCLEFLFGFH